VGGTIFFIRAGKSFQPLSSDCCAEHPADIIIKDKRKQKYCQLNNFLYFIKTILFIPLTGKFINLFSHNPIAKAKM
jgi:predicted nucleic acid-binding Zn ribbon protein